MSGRGPAVDHSVVVPVVDEKHAARLEHLGEVAEAHPLGALVLEFI